MMEPKPLSNRQRRLNRETHARGAKRDREDLLRLLEQQRKWLRRSCAHYDSGDEDEAVRAAVTLRTLLHHTSESRALLEQLGLTKELRWTDSAGPIQPRSLPPVMGLVGLQVHYSPRPEESMSAYAPHYERYSAHPAKRFGSWWEAPVMIDPKRVPWSRKELVLHMANREGGVHIDPFSTPDYEQLVREGFGATVRFSTPQGAEMIERPPIGSVFHASIRQIAYETEHTLSNSGLPELDAWHITDGRAADRRED